MYNFHRSAIGAEEVGLTETPRTMECMDNIWVAVFWGLLPTVVVFGLFVMILRGILRFDRRERRAYSRIEAEERARRGLPPSTS